MKINVFYCVVATAIVALSFVARGVADDKAEPSGDLKAMQGSWDYTTGDGGKGTWVFENDKLTLTLPSRKYVMKIKLDENAKPNKAVDFSIEEGPDESAGKKTLGIYQIDGDSLTICIGGAEETERPDKFETEFPRRFVFKMSRTKKS
jgi:uncharacterized protein (TIGR03067 family)